MRSSIERCLAAFMSFLVLGACQTTKDKQDSKDADEEAEFAREAPRYLDWSALEARLADQGPAIDAVARGQIAEHRRVVEEREHELSEWIVPLLNSYLPRGDQVKGRVVFDLGLPQPVEITIQGIAYIDVTAPEWKSDSRRLWTEVVSALYRCSLMQALPVQLHDPDTAEAFADNVLQRLMIDGLATYVTAQGAPVAKDSTPDAALMLRDEKSERFQKLEIIMASPRSCGACGPRF
jgi:hypothetical protein